MQMRTNKGFTLVEIMIVLAIIGIGAIIAGSSILDWITHNRSVGFHRGVAQKMEEARNRAVSSQRQHRVVIDTTGNNVSLERGDKGAGSTTWTQVTSAITAPHGSSIDNVLTTQGSVTTNTSAGTVNITVNPACDTFPLDLVRIYISNDLGEDWTVRVFGWTSRVRVENGTT
jgi:prepilin-type N-terminal cleavage/methylation domain-containing protein